jgi:parallel beta-helix repeat protein
MGARTYRFHRTRLTIACLVLTVVSTSCNSAGAGTETTVTIPPADVPTSLPPPTDVPATTTTTVTTSEPIVDEHTVVITPADDAATIVAAAPAGTRFVFTSGIHRTSAEIRPKDGMVFEGNTGATLSGAIELSGFSAAGDRWTLTGLALDDFNHGSCIDDYESCGYRNDLFMDDQMLWRVDREEEVIPGSWWSDGSTIVVADNPTTRRVELSSTPYAFVGDADEVTIRGLVVEKYATLAQDGAIQAQIPGDAGMGSGWLLENVETRLNHAAGIRTGDRTTIRRVHSHHNGQEGITGDRGSGILVVDSEVDHNNTRGFAWGWEAGGVKFTRTTGLTVRNTNVHDNRGPGLWTDISCYATTYEDNVVTDNIGPGIFHEISYDAVIRNNDVSGNGFDHAVWLWGAGILIAASSGVEVTGNTVTANANGITGIQQDRMGEDGPYLLADLWVHDNTVSMPIGQTGVAEDVGDNTVFTDRNLVFDRNTYLEADGRAFAWNGRNLTWRQWVDAGQDENGTYERG